MTFYPWPQHPGYNLPALGKLASKAEASRSVPACSFHFLQPKCVMYRLLLGTITKPQVWNTHVQYKTAVMCKHTFPWNEANARNKVWGWWQPCNLPPSSPSAVSCAALMRGRFRLCINSTVLNTIAHVLRIHSFIGRNSPLFSKAGGSWCISIIK